MIIAIVIGVSCLFWIIAAILFVCAKGVDRRISESKKDCVEKTTATVVDVEEVYKRNVDTYNYTWYPAYEFYVNGERVVQKSVIGTGKNSVQTGQQTISIILSEPVSSVRKYLTLYVYIFLDTTKPMIPAKHPQITKAIPIIFRIVDTDV